MGDTLPKSQVRSATVDVPDWNALVKLIASNGWLTVGSLELLRKLFIV